MLTYNTSSIYIILLLLFTLKLVLGSAQESRHSFNSFKKAIILRLRQNYDDTQVKMLSAYRCEVHGYSVCTGQS